MFQAQAEQNKLKGLLEKAENEKSLLGKEKQEISKKVSAAEDILKTNSANIAEMDKKRAAIEAEKVSSIIS